MGLKQISHATDITGAAVVSREDISTGVLRSLTVYLGIGGTSKGELRVRVTLERGQHDNIMAVATPIDDYVYDGHQPHWDGQIPIDPNDVLTLTTWSTVIRTVLLNAATSCGMTEPQSRAC